jgi:hypothetical protein
VYVVVVVSSIRASNVNYYGPLRLDMVAKCESCGTTTDVVPCCGANEDRNLCISCETRRRMRDLGLIG